MNVLLLGAENQTRSRLGSALWSSGFAVDAAGLGDAEARLSTGKPYALILLNVAPSSDL